MTEPPGKLLAGQVGKPHGLGGEVYVVPISDDPHRFDPGSPLIHERAGDLIVEHSYTHHQRLLVKFEGIATREAAEGLRGALYVTPDALRELEESEFWEHELLGCAVTTPEGGEVGEIVALIPGPAQDLLEVQTPAGPRYVPAVKELIVEVDLAARRVVVDAPPGLLD